jgi:hypothetical protein
VKKFVEKMLNKLLEIQEEMLEDMKLNLPVTIIDMDNYFEKFMSRKLDLADLLPLVRELYCYYKQVSVFIIL